MRIGQRARKLIPKDPDGRPRKTTDTAVDSFYRNTKRKAVEALGFSAKQAERFETMASHPDLVEQVKSEARENDDLPTRAAVLNLAKYKEKKAKDLDARIDEDYRLAMLLNKALFALRDLPTDKDSVDAMRRGGALTADDTRCLLRKVIGNLIRIQREYEGA